MEIEEAQKELSKVRIRQRENKKVGLAQIQAEYSEALKELSSAEARVRELEKKAREQIPASEATYKEGDRVWVIPMRLFGTVKKVRGFSIYNKTIGAMYEVETARNEVYHELLLRGSEYACKTG